MQRKYAIIRIISVLVVLIVWQAYSTYNKSVLIMNPAFLPAPTDIFQTALKYWNEGRLIPNIWVSFVRVMKGFTIGTILAVIIGYFMAKNPVFENIIDPIFSLLGSIPAYAFMPLFIIWFGVGEDAKTILIAYSTCMPVLTYTVQGVKSVDPLLIRSAKSLGADNGQVFRKVVMKTALPFIITGMKVSLALSFGALIVAEMMGADSGLGFIIVDSRNWFRVSDMFLSMVLIGLMYIIMQSVLTFIESKCFKWKKSGLSDAVE